MLISLIMERFWLNEINKLYDRLAYLNSQTNDVLKQILYDDYIAMFQSELIYHGNGSQSPWYSTYQAVIASNDREQIIGAIINLEAGT